MSLKFCLYSSQFADTLVKYYLKQLQIRNLLNTNLIVNILVQKNTVETEQRF